MSRRWCIWCAGEVGDVAVARSHPPTLETLARRLIREAALIRRGERVLVAVSGGPDSTALLHVLARLGGRMGFDVMAHGVDHGLRAAARGELEGASRVAGELGVVFGSTTLAVPTGPNLQARARAARRQALLAAADACGAAVIATGHHADDRAETVLMRLLSGSGPAGLACLPARAGRWVRPLLLARRTDVEAHLSRHGLLASLDPSNDDVRFMRVKVRREVMPLLGRLSPGIVEHLNGLADDLGRVPPEQLGAGLRRGQRTQASQGGPKGGRVRLKGGHDALVVHTQRGFDVSIEAERADARVAER